MKAQVFFFRDRTTRIVNVTEPNLVPVMSRVTVFRRKTRFYRSPVARNSPVTPSPRTISPRQEPPVLFDQKTGAPVVFGKVKFYSDRFRRPTAGQFHTRLEIFYGRVQHKRFPPTGRCCENVYSAITSNGTLTSKRRSTAGLRFRVRRSYSVFFVFFSIRPNAITHTMRFP